MPYLSFTGDCEEAFLWYEEIFGGKIQHMVKYQNMPATFVEKMEPEQRNKVMHAQLMLTENGGISGADSFQPLEQGGALSIHAHLPSVEKAEKVFSALAKGGTVLGELATNPPPDDTGVSGCVKDKYGFVWIISAMKAV